MATLRINVNDSREYAIFQAFTRHDKYTDALKEMEAYDKQCDGAKIFNHDVDKKSMQRCFMFFKKAEAVVARDGGKSDYDDPVIVERLKTVFETQIRSFCTLGQLPFAQGVATKKSIIGNMIDKCTRTIHKMEPRDWQRIAREKDLIQHEQARVDRSGVVGHGGVEGSVFSQKSGNGDKSIREILFDRACEERRKNRH